METRIDKVWVINFKIIKIHTYIYIYTHVMKHFKLFLTIKYCFVVFFLC